MAVAYDAGTFAESANTGTTFTFSHTVGAAGASRGMLVTIGSSSQSLPSSVTYAGQALTLVGSSQEGVTGKRLSIWSRIQPGTGINNVVVAFPSAVAAVVCVHSFTGVDQASMTGAYIASTGETTTPALSVISDADELVVDHLCFTAPGFSATVGASQTSRFNTAINGSMAGAGSTEPGQAVTNMTWTLSGGTAWVYAAVAVQAAVAPAKGTIARVLIPMSYPRGKWKKGQTPGFVAVQGLQAGPAFEFPVPPSSEFFTACCMG